VSDADFGPDLLPRLYARHAGDLAALEPFEAQLPDLGYSVHKEARKVLYLMVRHAAPDLVVEISPKRGLSTLHIALALEHNGRGRVASFEIDRRALRRAEANLRRNKLDHRVSWHLGDARVEVPRRLAGAGDLPFLFLDSDHGAEFARWYLRELFPRVRPGGLIHVDDVMTDPREWAARLDRFPMPPSGEEGEVVPFLLGHADRYVWFSLADCVRRPAYLEAVRPFGGGRVEFDAAARPGIRRVFGDAVRTEWNPSLWVRKLAEPREAAR
jgi:predicted O-methyltransferase YrrM